MKLEFWRSDLLAATIRFWNGAFSGKLNFVPLTRDLFRARVVERPGFNPRGFIVARQGREILGVIHTGRRGRGTGYIALLYVLPQHRRKGIGTRLWHLGREAIRSAPTVTVLNGWENPFYGARAGETPLWGAPWGIGIEWGDSKSLKFLARKGHPPRGRAVLYDSGQEPAVSWAIF